MSDPLDAYEMLMHRKKMRETTVPALATNRKAALISRPEDGLQQAAEFAENLTIDASQREANKAKSSYERLGGRHLAIVTAGSADAYLPSGAVAPANAHVDLPDAVLLRAQCNGAENVLETISDKGVSLNHGLRQIISQQATVDRPPTVLSIKQDRRTDAKYRPLTVDYETVFEVDESLDC